MACGSVALFQRKQVKFATASVGGESRCGRQQAIREEIRERLACHCSRILVRHMQALQQHRLVMLADFMCYLPLTPLFGGLGSNENIRFASGALSAAALRL